MSTPEPKKGNEESGKVSVSLASDLLMRAAAEFGTDSPERETIMKAVSELAKKFAVHEGGVRELIPTQIAQLVGSLPQAGGATPEQKAMQGAPLPGQQPPMPV
jgi:hypothetical protein